MIQELELSFTDPIVAHFKELFEVNEPLRTFIPNEFNDLLIQQQPNPCWAYWLNDKYVVDDNISTIISKVRDLMKQNGFESDDSTGAFVSELHYSYTNGDGIMSNTFAIHEDDYGLMDYPVNTFILYLDVHCEGGELIFYNKKPDIICSPCLFSECINESTRYEPFRTVETHNPTKVSCKVVIFNGSIYHKPNTIVNGHRLSIMIQIPRE
jgi:hypothetical protein